MAWYCIVFDIIAVYCMSPHCILLYGMVLHFIWSYCTVSHRHVPLLQRAGELPRSASSHFVDTKQHPVGQNGETGGYYFYAFLQMQSNGRFLFAHKILWKI